MENKITLSANLNFKTEDIKLSYQIGNETPKAIDAKEVNVSGVGIGKMAYQKEELRGD